MNIIDYHTHTTFSDGLLHISELVEISVQKKISIGISDHIFCKKVITQSDAENYLDQLNMYDVYKGAEVNLEDSYKLSDKLNNGFDYIISSIHSLVNTDGAKISLTPYFSARSEGKRNIVPDISKDNCKRYLETFLVQYENAFKNNRVDILGHCTVTPVHEIMAGTSYLSHWEYEMIHLCKKYNVAVEISGLWKEPGESLIRRILEQGVKLSAGSDCHMPTSACDIEYPKQMLEKLHIGDKNLLIL